MFKKFVRNTAIFVVAAAAAATPVFAQSADWQRQVARLIAAKQAYPQTARMRGEGGTVTATIYVGATGALDRTEPAAPAGSSPLEREAPAMLAVPITGKPR